MRFPADNQKLYFMGGKSDPTMLIRSYPTSFVFISSSHEKFITTDEKNNL